MAARDISEKLDLSDIDYLIGLQEIKLRVFIAMKDDILPSVFFANFDSAMQEAMFSISHKDGLTYIEFLQAITDMEQSRLKYMLRDERHPGDTSKPSGLA